jgi:hypothetical protein
MSPEQHEHLPTKALLGRLVRLRKCEEAPEASDLDADELATVLPIRFKSDPEWQAACEDVRAVLATREHLPSGPEREAARKRRASRSRAT